MITPPSPRPFACTDVVDDDDDDAVVVESSSLLLLLLFLDTEDNAAEELFGRTDSGDSYATSYTCDVRIRLRYCSSDDEDKACVDGRRTTGITSPDAYFDVEDDDDDDDDDAAAEDAETFLKISRMRCVRSFALTRCVHCPPLCVCLLVVFLCVCVLDAIIFGRRV